MHNRTTIKVLEAAFPGVRKSSPFSCNVSNELKIGMARLRVVAFFNCQDDAWMAALRASRRGWHVERISHAAQPALRGAQCMETADLIKVKHQFLRFLSFRYHRSLGVIRIYSSDYDSHVSNFSTIEYLCQSHVIWNKEQLRHFYKTLLKKMADQEAFCTRNAKSGVIKPAFLAGSSTAIICNWRTRLARK